MINTKHRISYFFSSPFLGLTWGIFFTFFFSLTVSAENPVNEFINNPLHRSANISLKIVEVSSGKILQNHRAEHLTIPASTMKLITTASALEILGADFRFCTTLEIDGHISSDNVLNGNLYIRGSGDPTLGSSKLGDQNFLSDWVEAVRAAGIHRINGDIIADISVFDSEGVNPKWLWEDMGNYFAAGAYGIAYKDNTYLLRLNSGALGTTPQIVDMTPNIPELSFSNYLKSTTIKYDSAYIYGAPYANERYIYGAIPANRASFTIKGDMPRPGLVLARDFALKLKSSGVLINGKTIDGFFKANRKVIFSHKSAPLKDIIKEININSNNLYAEQLFRYLGSGQNSVSTTNAAIQRISSFWKSKGLPVSELSMVDGCGLSPMNGVSANFFVELLAYMNRSKNADFFRASLPVAGKSGTIRGLLKGSSLEGRVRAKSGSISKVRCYAGYADTKAHSYAFAVMVNNPNSSSTSATTRKIETLLLQSIK